MATDKKAVVFYVDWIHVFESLEDDEAGKLVKHFLRYVNDQNPEPPDKLTKIAFEPIKQQLKRDLVKWEVVKETKSAAGHAGGIKSGEARRKQKEANEAYASNTKQKEANEAVTVTGTVIVKDIVTGNGILPEQKNIFNAEDEILKNPIESERLCMKANFTDKKKFADVLRKFHLHLESNDKYPQNKKQVFAGFEKWLMNEVKFNNNGTHQQINTVGRTIEFDKP
jgi:hypothetical protein